MYVHLLTDKASPGWGPEKAILLWQTRDMHTHNTGAELFKSVASSKCSQNILSPSRRAATPVVLPGDQDWLQETQSFSSGGPFSVWEEKETSHSFTVSKRPASFTRQVNKFSLHEKPLSCRDAYSMMLGDHSKDWCRATSTQQGRSPGFTVQERR